MNDLRSSTLSAVATIALVFAASTACADAIVPKMFDTVIVTVTYEGEPLDDQGAVVALLSLAVEGHEPISKAKPVPRLDTLKLDDPSGEMWTYAGYLWGGENENGKFRFNGFAPVGGVIPDQVRK